MKTIVVFNQKGGVGKTSTVANLMSELTARHYKVLAIDLDAQCNLSVFCGARNANLSVCEWLLKTATLNDVIVNTQYGDVVPASDTLQVELLHFASIPAFIIRLRELLTVIDKRYDYILIDCPPAVNQLTATALVAADYVLVPTETEFFSADGVGKIAETIEQVKSLNSKIKVLGVLLVKYNARRKLTQALEYKLFAATENLLNCGILKTRIRFTVDIPAAQASGMSLKDYKPNGKATQEYSELCDEILNLMRSDDNER